MMVVRNLSPEVNSVKTGEVEGQLILGRVR